MQPKIINKDILYIAGLTGNGTKTGEVWSEFDNQYNINPFPKADDSGYEIRFGDSGNIHVGFAVDNSDDIDGFETVAIPAAEYAVFGVYVANGYDSGNAEMEAWLADNASKFGQLQLDGREFVIECYNEKFKDGDKPDSIVEIWIPIYRICR